MTFASIETMMKENKQMIEKLRDKIKTIVQHGFAEQSRLGFQIDQANDQKREEIQKIKFVCLRMLT